MRRKIVAAWALRHFPKRIAAQGLLAWFAQIAGQWHGVVGVMIPNLCHKTAGARTGDENQACAAVPDVVPNGE